VNLPCTSIVDKKIGYNNGEAAEQGFSIITRDLQL
jgi:hypothetical protein